MDNPPLAVVPLILFTTVAGGSTLAGALYALTYSLGASLGLGFSLALAFLSSSSSFFLLASSSFFLASSFLNSSSLLTYGLVGDLI